LEVVDGEMYNSMMYILDNPIEGIIFENFSVLDKDGNEQELKKGGKEIEVRTRLGLCHVVYRLILRLPGRGEVHGAA
jgi:hypothetical protein